MFFISKDELIWRSSMYVPVLVDQQQLIYISSEWTQEVV